MSHSKKGGKIQRKEIKSTKRKQNERDEETRGRVQCNLPPVLFSLTVSFSFFFYPCLLTTSNSFCCSKCQSATQLLERHKSNLEV